MKTASPRRYSQLDVKPPQLLLGTRSIEAATRLLTGEDTVSGYESFASQLDLFGIVGEQEPPQAIFFTTNSAIPLADVVRGVYDAAELLWCTKQLPKRHSVSLPTGSILQTVAEAVTGTQTAVVIDQYRWSGATIKGAKRLLEHYEVGDVRQLTGRWYHQAPASLMEIDTVEMTSSLAENMVKAGHKCYEAYVNDIRE